MSEKTDKMRLHAAVKRALDSANKALLAALGDGVTGFGRRKLERLQSGADVPTKSEAITIVTALRKLGRHVRAKHIEEWIKGSTSAAAEDD
jgi:hypothetical protein